MGSTTVSSASDLEVAEETSQPVVTRLALVVEYDGTYYFGFQLQADRPTIQGEMERALQALTGEVTRVATASRTDAGVHAMGQVVSFETASGLPREAFIHGLNHHLPSDIAVKTARFVANSFDARRDAVSREYRYTILNSQTRSPVREGFACRVAGSLDVGAMDRATRLLLGEHDFSSFASDVAGEVKSMVREVYRIEVGRDGEMVFLDIVANAFLRHQVRSTAGCLVRIGQHKMTVDEFREIISAGKPGLAGPTLPAHGLCLMRVDYPAWFQEERV